MNNFHNIYASTKRDYVHLMQHGGNDYHVRTPKDKEINVRNPYENGKFLKFSTTGKYQNTDGYYKNPKLHPDEILHTDGGQCQNTDDEILRRSGNNVRFMLFNVHNFVKTCSIANDADADEKNKVLIRLFDDYRKNGNSPMQTMQYPISSQDLDFVKDNFTFELSEEDENIQLVLTGMLEYNSQQDIRAALIPAHITTVNEAFDYITKDNDRKGHFIAETINVGSQFGGALELYERSRRFSRPNNVTLQNAEICRDRQIFPQGRYADLAAHGGPDVALIHNDTNIAFDKFMRLAKDNPNHRDFYSSVTTDVFVTSYIHQQLGGRVGNFIRPSAFPFKFAGAQHMMGELMRIVTSLDRDADIPSFIGADNQENYANCIIDKIDRYRANLLSLNISLFGNDYTDNKGESTFDYYVKGASQRNVPIATTLDDFLFAYYPAIRNKYIDRLIEYCKELKKKIKIEVC